MKLKEMESKNRPGRLRTTFEDLEAWQQARALSNAISSMTRMGELAKDFRLRSQMQSTAVSFLFYVAEDNFKEASAEAKRLRVATNVVERGLTAVLGSNNRRRDSSARGAILALFGPVSYLLSASFYQTR